jgi:sugar diacid utilization regulator
MHTTAATALRALLAERRAETEAVLGLVRRIASSLDVDEILTEAVSLAAELTGCAGALVYVLDEEAGRLTVRAGAPGYEPFIGRFSLELGTGLTGWTALNRTPAVIRENPRDDPRYVFVPELNDDAFQSALTFPLVAPSERLVGVLTLHTVAPHEFTADDFALVGPIASLAAAAVENAELAADRARQLAALRELARAVDDPRTPPGRRRALHRLCEGARQLVGADAALIAVRDPRGGWSLGAASSPQRTWHAPERLARAALLEPLRERAGRLSRAGHAALFDRLALDGAAPVRGVSAPLRAGGEDAGVLLCLGGDAQPGAGTLDALQALASAAAQIVSSERLIEQAAGRNPGRELLDALVAGDAPEPVIAARARRLGLDLAEQHVALIARAAGAPDPEALLGRLRDELASRFPGSLGAIRDAELRAVVRARDESRLAERVGAAARAAGGRRVRCTVGISRPCAAPGRYPEAFGEAAQALTIGGALHGPAAVTRFEDLGVQRYLWSLAQEPARDVWQERLERLRDYDAGHGSALLQTVEQYLQANANRKDAAERLFVHRNTLRQRFERIRRIAGIDLDDPTVLFDLQVALRIVRFREAARDVGGL